MFKKIGKKVPDHHLLFFSSVLTILFFIVLFNPFDFPPINNNVKAATHNCNSCVSCQTVINSSVPGDTINLTQDINNNNSDCIEITKDNITFNCNNHLIDGVSENHTAISIISNNSNLVKNCNISEFNMAIYTTQLASANIFENINTSNNTNGFYSYGNNTIILNSSSDSDSMAIQLVNMYTSLAVIDNVNINNADVAVSILDGGQDLNIINSTFTNSTFDDVRINDFSSSVDNITFYGNSFGGSVSIQSHNYTTPHNFDDGIGVGNTWAVYDSNADTPSCLDTTPVDGICDTPYEVWSTFGIFDNYPVYTGVDDVDAIPPTATIVLPSTTGSYTTTNSNVMVSGTANDNINLNDVDIQINGGGWTTIPGSNNINGTDDSWSRDIVLSDYGLNIIEIRVSDDAGFTNINSINIYYLPINGELFGYMWTDTIGWISMTSKNCDPDGNFLSDSNIDGCPKLADGDSIIVSQYKTIVDPNTGHLSGYAWSENVGWISFQHNNAGEYTSDPPLDVYSFNTNCFTYNDGDSTNDCVAANNCISCYTPDGGGVPTGKFYGWANIIVLGDDGWIRLDDHNGPLAPSYGVNFDILNSEFYGYAWNGSNSASNPESAIGWISTNCIDADNDCNVSDYKTRGALNRPPSVSFSTSASLSFPCGATQACLNDCEKEPIIGWDYSDPEGFPQKKYHFILDDDNNLNNGELIDTGEVTSSITQIDIAAAPYNITLDYGTTYYLYIEVWDNFYLESGQVSYSSTTYEHQFPNPSFDWFISEGSANEEIKFWDTSTYYFDNIGNNIDLPGELGDSYLWSSTDVVVGSISDPTLATTTAIYPAEAYNQQMFLDVTDADAYTCGTSTSMYINKKLPSWVEVR